MKIIVRQLIGLALNSIFFVIEKTITDGLPYVIIDYRRRLLFKIVCDSFFTDD